MKLRAQAMDVNYSRILQGALMDLFDGGQAPSPFRHGKSETCKLPENEQSDCRLHISESHQSNLE